MTKADDFRLRSREGGRELVWQTVWNAGTGVHSCLYWDLFASSHAGQGWFSAQRRQIPTLMDWRGNVDLLDDTTHGVCCKITSDPSRLLWGEKWDATTECARVCQDHEGYELAG